MMGWVGSTGRRRVAATALAAVMVCSAPAPFARAPVPIADRAVTYILPQWTEFLTVSEAEVAVQVQRLRDRIGEGPRARVGFTMYVVIDMLPVSPTDTAAVQAALAPVFAQVDTAIGRARPHGIPICISFLTAIRDATDSAQDAAQLEDRRTLQWHADNSLASGWVSHSRYSRKFRQLQEAYIRELGRGLAARMAADPETLVAGSGDGEVELSFEKAYPTDPTRTPATSLYADYSPFAVAEFRDWLRQGGLYAAGQPLAGEAWTSSSRYAGDTSPAVDSNSDGHTLNGDFLTTFTSWDLRHFDWSLADDINADPHAIPATEYGIPTWVALPGTDAARFDAPRAFLPGNAWWELWNEFRQTMIWRYNRDFAKWITTSQDPASGYTVPVERWFTDQIPADYLFGHTPANPDYRLHSSASPFWTADVSPYGSLGITSFNTNLGGNQFAKTLAGVAPAIAQRNVRWGVFEWNPAVPFNADIAVYRQEMALVEQYRPSVLAPWYWDSLSPTARILDTGFETALRELVDRIKRIPLTLNRTRLIVAATSDGASRTPAQAVRVSADRASTPPLAVESASSFLEVTAGSDGRTFSVTTRPLPMAPGTYSGTVVIASSNADYAPVTLTVDVTVHLAGATGAPRGLIETPADDAVVFGETAVTGWAIDDVGVESVRIYRTPVGAEPTHPNGLVLVGAATFVDGSRTDIANTYPGDPMNLRAGWGYMLLTNMLPGQGNGPFTLSAFAQDYDGKTTLLGTKRILAQNQTSTRPFGTIDTPQQGQTVSGTVVNFGWALTPNPGMIPVDGSTIGVYVDNVFQGRPVYNNPRADIAALFPGYANTGGAVGYFMLDTTRFSNGVHTIAWVVFDNLGRGQGIGSRFFTIAN